MSREEWGRGVLVMALVLASNGHLAAAPGGAVAVGRGPVGELAPPFELGPELAALVRRQIPPTGGEQRRLQRVLDWIFGELHLRYALQPTRNADATFAAREGNCLSFVNLFVGAARAVRLAPFYVEVTDLSRWSYAAGTVVSQGHIVAGLYVRGELRTFDFLPGRPKSYRHFEPIDDATATAHYFNNLGAERLIGGDLEGAWEQLTKATRVAPTFARALNNLGVVEARRGADAAALATYRRGLELAPEDPALLTNLARLFQRTGETDRAEELLDRLERLRIENPFFYVYRGEAALATGDSEAGLAYLARALRLGSEVPEVHLALAKAYLGLGRLDEARHHLERALRLDATNPEGRRLAVLLEPSP